MNFFPRLKELRLEKGLTQEEVASAIYYPSIDYSKIESGEEFPALFYFEALAIFFGVSCDYLLERTDKRMVNR